MRAILVAFLLMMTVLSGCADVGEPVADAGETDDTVHEDHNTTMPVDVEPVGPVLVVESTAINGSAPLNVTLAIGILGMDNATALEWMVSNNGTELANGTGLPANATFLLDAGNHTILIETANGLEHALNINVTGASVALMDVTATPGVKVPLVSGATGACAWDIPDALSIEDAAACDTIVRFGSVGEFPVTLSVDGTPFTMTVTTLFPEPADRVTGSLFMYNTGGAGASNVIGLGAGDYHYVTGDTVSTQGRSMTGDLAGIVDGAEYVWLDADGTVVAGPLSAGSGSGASWTGQDLPITTATFPDDGGRYYLGAIAYMADGPVWVKDTSDARNGFKGFIVHHVA